MVTLPTTPASTDAQAALVRLRAWLEQFDSVIVAYSGGVDSALVLAIAHETLGLRALGCIGVSPSYPERELSAATELARRLGAAVKVVQTAEHLDPRYAANPGNRCYFCKSELYSHLKQIAGEGSFAVILDGTNESDLHELRPGYAAARERGVRSPLAELGFDKPLVREMARALGLAVWDKPAMPCLASRVPTGTAIVPELLKRIETAETALAQMGFTQFRVRHHGDVARIELPVDDFVRALEFREAIIDAVRAAGYRFVSLDLAGFRSGSLTS